MDEILINKSTTINRCIKRIHEDIIDKRLSDLQKFAELILTP